MSTYDPTFTYEICVRHINKLGFLIDVLIFDHRNSFDTVHYDKTQKYIAFISFASSYYNCTINWNITCKDDFTDMDECIEYKKKYKDTIIEIAITAFNNTYSAFQPEKTWKQL
jgi:hypothetical protein